MNYVRLNDDELMVVPNYTTGSSMNGTKKYYWKAVKGRGFCNYDTIVCKEDKAISLAKKLTEENKPF